VAADEHRHDLTHRLDAPNDEDTFGRCLSWKLEVGAFLLLTETELLKTRPAVSARLPRFAFRFEYSERPDTATAIAAWAPEVGSTGRNMIDERNPRSASLPT
jgi:hypothetical protein